MRNCVFIFGLVMLGWFSSSCAASPTAPPPSPTPVATAARAQSPAPAATSAIGPTSAPAATPTSAVRPTSAPAATPTSAAAAPKASTRAEVNLRWDGANIADIDDISDLVIQLKDTPGIIGGLGDEFQITIIYDPQLITVERIQRLLTELGFPNKK